MKKFYLIFTIAILTPVLPTVYAFVKLGPLYSQIEDQDVAAAYRVFANQVENNELSNTEIASRINRMANAEDKVSRGISIIRLGAYFWGITVFFIALFQVYLIRELLITHNKLNQTGTPQSGADLVPL